MGVDPNLNVLRSLAPVLSERPVSARCAAVVAADDASVAMRCHQWIVRLAATRARSTTTSTIVAA